MVGWKEWLGKQVYITSKNSKHGYEGEVVEVDDTSSSSLIWLTIIDKFKKRVTFLITEITLIKEEGER